MNQLEVIKLKEKHLGFEPIVGKYPLLQQVSRAGSWRHLRLRVLCVLTLTVTLLADAHQKLQELKKIKLVHQQLLLESEESSEGVEEILATYNELVERISTHI